MKYTAISNSDPEKFVSCRVGLELSSYTENLASTLSDNHIYGLRNPDVGNNNYVGNAKGNFILVPIAPPLSKSHNLNSHLVDSKHDPDQLLPDLVLPKCKWENEVAISISEIPPPYPEGLQASISRFDRLLKHALYLPTHVIVVDMPSTKQAQKAMADVIRTRLSGNHSQRLILIRVCLTPPSRPATADSSSLKQDDLPESTTESHTFVGTSDAMTAEMRDDSSTESGYDQCSQTSKTSEQDTLLSGWEGWNTFRSYLAPDHRIGVCLVIDNDMENDDLEDTNRWRGEPVRMIIMGLNRFSFIKGFQNTMRPAGGIKEFIKMIAVSNSLMTSFVVQLGTNCDAQEQLECLSGLCDHLELEFPDFMRAWDDVLLDPLQPLSNNLDSSTYAIFEQDKAKYSKYHEAMLEALGCLLTRQNNRNRTRFTLMVLGAGRGPLVDAMILAIHKLRLRNRFFTIYALDKNNSSIVSLKYKKTTEWDSHLPNIEIKIVQEDMRLWEPKEKADIIATELLGSFSDNELSPECIDGTWRFSTPQTISIPQSYSSFLAPICSYRMRQELHKASILACNRNQYDRIQVVRLKNYYLISNPKRLFTFEHRRLDLPPLENSNEREVNLSFYTNVETTCHGFAGYFEATLFGRVSISTNPDTKTMNMESWFPVYVPLEEPVVLSAGSMLEVTFSRKENHERVWYEWSVVTPEPSRIHCKGGEAAFMSKIIQ